MKMSSVFNTSFTCNNSYSNPFVHLTVQHFGFNIVKHAQSTTDSYPAYRLHYIVQGKVLLTFGDEEITLKDHSAFIIIPNSGISYTAIADEENPLVFYWCAYTGTQAQQYTEICALDVSRPYHVLDEKIELIDYFYDACANRYNDDFIKNLIFTKDLFCILLALHNRFRNHVALPPVLHNEVVNRACEYINEHYADPTLSLTSLAHELSIHPVSLARLFCSELNTTFVKYLTVKRLDIASNLLLFTKKTVSEIAYEVGFNDPLYFSRTYRRYMTVSPTTTRKQNEEKQIKEKAKNP